MRALRRILGLVLMAPMVAGACNGSGGSATAHGTVAGASFNVARALASCPGSNKLGCAMLGVELYSRGDNDCSSAGKTPANSEELTLLLENTSGEPVATGLYELAPGGTLTGGAFLIAHSSTCEVSSRLNATSGSITVREVSASRIAGEYTVIFGAQGSFTGGFDVPMCEPQPGVCEQ